MTIWDAYFIGCLFAMFSLAFPPIKERRHPIPRTAKRKATTKKPKSAKPKKKRTKAKKEKRHKAQPLSVDELIKYDNYRRGRDKLQYEQPHEF
jgi:hypothetical protein